MELCFIEGEPVFEVLNKNELKELLDRHEAETGTTLAPPYAVRIPDGNKKVKKGAFAGCTEIAEVKFSDDVDTISEEAFKGCTGLTDVNIWAKTVGKSAFEDCTGLKEIYISDFTEKIYDSSFRGCSGLTGIYVGEDNEYFRSGCNAIVTRDKGEGVILVTGCQNTKIPHDTTKIWMNAFMGCKGLTSIYIPDSVKQIAFNAFRDCDSLAEISVNEKSVLQSVDLPNRTKVIERIKFTIPTKAFAGRTDITSYNIPEGISVIGACAFEGCKGLTEIIIPDGVKEIHPGAFADCSSLKRVVFADSVERISAKAFERCCSLETIVLPKGLKFIGFSAFLLAMH